jgi:hypothetical protein
MSDDYPPAIAELLAIAHPVSLGPGSPNREAGDQLQRLDAARLFGPALIRDQDMAMACLAGLWLRFDFLDRSHEISQGIDTPAGGFWHAIMHRREPDSGNSKYWYRRIDSHLVVAALRQQAAPLGYSYTTPAAFVDYCEHVRSTGSRDEEVGKQVQMLEWRLLFDDCVSAAIS